MKRVIYAGCIRTQLGVVLVCPLLLSGCVSFGPSEWRPDQHVMVMRQCKISCHPGRMQTYDAIDGTCSCAAAAAGATK
jgi:hypothetical protein